ncbi:MAG: hypothetical protein ACYTG5_23025 [Planctomycetota bacterium]
MASKIRETHRSVLEWMRFEGRDVQVMSLQLSAADLRSCSAALQDGDPTWQSEAGNLRVEAGNLRVERRDVGLDLQLQSTGINAAEQSLSLDPEAAARMQAAFGEFMSKGEP